MKKILKQIKQIFVDNKEYFIRCTIMTLITGLILGISISLVVPASAADEPIESDQVVIPAGTYTWDDSIAFFEQVNNPARNYSFSFSCEPIVITEGNESYTFGEFTGINILYNNDYMILSYTTEILGIPEVVIYTTDDGWNSFHLILPQIPSGYGKTINIPNDVSVPSDFGEWFLNSTNNGSSIIQAGYYKARDSWNTSGFPVTNDSIDIRYYNDAINVQEYVEAEGIAFLYENDIVEIYYADSAVFTDGWNIDGAKNIQVLQDIFVDSDFYTVFNNIFEPSSQGSNEFESGYASGYADGFLAGEDVGYTQGYFDGMTESSGNFFTDILGGVLGALDSFTIFGGFSLLDLLTTLLGGMALIWILKLLAGG